MLGEMVMSMIDPTPAGGPEAQNELDEVARRGFQIYETTLKSLLEPQYDGHTVAIHVDTGDYAVARASADAMRAMRKLHREGKLLLHTIGRASDPGLAVRMLGHRVISNAR